MKLPNIRSSLSLRFYIALATRILLSVFIIFCFRITSVSGQGEQARFVELLDAESNLNDAYNYFLKEDSRGFLWISSLGKVYRYNGLEVKDFSSKIAHNISGEEIAISNVQSDFFEDSSGNIWFAVATGIVCYRRAEGYYQTYQLKNGKKGFINSGYCLFHLQNDSTLWLKAEEQIFTYNPYQQQQKYICNTEGYRFTVDTTADGQVKTIYACPWLGASGIEVIKETGQDWTTTLHLTDFLVSVGKDKLEVSKVILENDRCIWALSNKALIDYDPLSKKVNGYYDIPTNPDDFVKDGVMYQDRYLLLGAKLSGLQVFDKKTKNFIDPSPYSQEVGEGIPGSDIAEVQLTESGHLWLSGHSQAKVSNIWWENTNQFLNPFEKLNKEKVSVSALLEDTAGNIWCATLSDGLYVFDADGELLNRYAYSAENASEGLPPVNCLSLDHAGNIWAGSTKALFRFQEGVWQRIYQETQERIYGMQHLSDSQKILSTDANLYLLEKKGDAWKRRPINQNQSFKSFQSYAAADKKHFYFGNNGNYFLALSWEADSLKIDTNLRVNADIYSFTETADGRSLLLGTSKGARSLSTTNWELEELYSEHSKLKNTHVYLIVEDENRKYWSLSNNGLWTGMPTDSLLINYAEKDGLATGEINLYASILSRDDVLWVGTKTGLQRVDLKKTQPYPYPVKVDLTDLEVNSLPYQLTGELSEVPSLDFSDDEQTFGFKMTAISYYNTEYNEIKYRLVNYDSIWKTAKNGDEVLFIKVPHGDYIFEYYGVNANGLAGEVKQLPINIDWPFWMKLKYLIPIFVGLGLLIYWGFNKYLQKRLNKQQEAFRRKEELRDALQKERNRIGADMHEELGGELTAIKLVAKKIDRNELSAADAKRLKEIEQHADDSVNNIREIIWAMNDNYDTLPDLAVYLRRFMVEFLRKGDIKCETLIPDDLPEEIVNSFKRRNLYLCIKECAHNILKHAQATQVQFSIHYHNKWITVEIKDNGKGLPEAAIQHFGNGLKNMQHRMAASGGSIEYIDGNGLLVRIKLPLDEQV